METRTKRKADADLPAVDALTCAICLETLTDSDDQFKGHCSHSFHVQCIEKNVVTRNDKRCPYCRATWTNAPGLVAMAKQPPAQPEAAPTVVAALHDVAPPETAPTPGGSVPDDWVSVSAVTDVLCVPPGVSTPVTALIKLKYADDTDEQPITVPTDFVVLADVSGSMAGPKIEAVRDTLLKVSDMFGPQDRVALVTFNHGAVQLTPLAPLSVQTHEAEFRRAAMNIEAGGGTDITSAVRLARDILLNRTHINPLAQILLMSDGQDSTAMRHIQASDVADISTLGYGSDHDAELLSTIASRGKGSFSYVERMDILDETFAAYLGGATSVVAVNVTARIMPSPGTVINRVSGPGDVSRQQDGSFTLCMRAAPVDALRQVLVECSVTPGSEAGFMTVEVNGMHPTEGRPLPGRSFVAPILHGQVVAAPDSTDIDAARNREAVANAAATVAQLLSSGGADEARSAVTATRGALVGSGEVRTAAEKELDALTDRIANDDNDAAYAYGLSGGLRNQQSLLGTAGRLSVPSKGSRKTAGGMMKKKAARI
jgi:hypothetical protein